MSESGFTGLKDSQEKSYNILRRLQTARSVLLMPECIKLVLLNLIIQTEHTKVSMISFKDCLNQFFVRYQACEAGIVRASPNNPVSGTPLC